MRRWGEAREVESAGAEMGLPEDRVEIAGAHEKEVLHFRICHGLIRRGVCESWLVMKRGEKIT